MKLKLIFISILSIAIAAILSLRLNQRPLKKEVLISENYGSELQNLKYFAGETWELINDRFHLPKGILDILIFLIFSKTEIKKRNFLLPLGLRISSR
ncbi:hypothetical protein LEP1GSC133_0722 [Leptospira borgpetersenii serovar Pomona str. 200901868]|uniref:Uncharacterized protein n=1 Tax=Leptospira borgpetersenii serovar Pomona str. 200901868 TaxID=1192866 RepID=M6W7I5_LEPBO|nr:hypothetical protein LEP1GSC133_0722 [Leptospira borgpetersenii serovar Pomona str. 200901868]